MDTHRSVLWALEWLPNGMFKTPAQSIAGSRSSTQNMTMSDLIAAEDTFMGG